MVHSHGTQSWYTVGSTQWGVRSWEYAVVGSGTQWGVHSTEYGVRSTQYAVHGTQWGVRSA